MNTLTNTSGLSLSMAVWLAYDEYTDGSEEYADKDVISATSLLKPTRQIILGARVPLSEQVLDVMDLFASRHGHALHNDIEKVWTNGYQMAMRRLGYPQSIIERVRINPDLNDPDWDDIIPVFLEQRAFREIRINGHPLIISGKFDQVINGELNDIKKTSVYAYINRSKEDDYRIQGSIYRWLNPEIVTSDQMKIQHIFTDWKKGEAARTKGYPPTPVLEFTVDLMTLQETEVWIRKKVNEILANQQLDDDQMIRCSDKELWKTDPVYKYYSDPKKAQEGGRATKNFDSYPAAAQYIANQKKGVVVTVPGKVKACLYCKARPICQQALEYELD